MLAIAAGCGGGGGGDPTPSIDDAATAASPVVTDTRESMLAELNAIRAVARDCGDTRYAAAGALRWNTALETAATEHAAYLQRTDTISHVGANGATLGQRVTATGYQWVAVGEDLAAGPGGASAVIAGWLSSAGHCANLMDAGHVDVGMARVPGAAGNAYAYYWTLVIARPRG